jgi:nucleoside-diphosphate-sugar epimerase
MEPTYFVLGCGFTGRRVASALAQRGEQVFAATKRENPELIPGVSFLRPSDWPRLPDGLRILHSVPLAQDAGGSWFDPTPILLAPLAGKVSRIVYLSTTGVYGGASLVDATTRVAPRSPRERLRVEAEDCVEHSAPSSLVLRPAAIYGPGRGVHVSIREGSFLLLGDGSNFISRIHVEDLAALALIALDHHVTGRYPVADEHPCPSREIAEFCARLMGVPIPASATREQLSETRRNNRQVDGSAIRELLGYRLRYPSYLQGIPASL